MISSATEDNSEDVQDVFLHGNVERENRESEAGEQNEDVDVNGVDIYCGIGSCRPRFAQRFRNMACFIATYIPTGVVTMALNMYLYSQITTLEKHFDFGSIISGFLMSCNDLGYLSVTLIVSFYTRRTHIPRGLAFSALLYGFSGVLCTSAFFATRHYIPSPPKDNDLNQTDKPVVVTHLCSNVTSHYNTSCENTTSGKVFTEVPETWRALAISIIAFSMILQGAGKSTRLPFLGTYIDDNVPKLKTSLYLGVIIGVSAIGPAIAYVLGGLFSNIYITLEETNMSPRDPRWLGAWWLGFLIFGLLAIFSAIPLFFFPNRMRNQKHSEYYKRTRESKKQLFQIFRDFKDFLRSMFRLVLNPVYACLVTGFAVIAMADVGLSSFLPKYLEVQYFITAAQANVVLGSMSLVSFPCGTVVGGYVISKLKLSPSRCLKFILGLVITSSLAVSAGVFFGCRHPVIDKGLVTSSSGGKIISQCVQDCNCDNENYFPVCGSENKNYFSPCYAGCSSMDQSTFTNCSCLAAKKTTRTARGGLCATECNGFYVFVVLLFLAGFSTTVFFVPGVIVVVRSVHERDKPLAIGLYAFMGTLIGYFLGPVIFGALVDTTCIKWRKPCASSGACALYNNELLRTRFIGLYFGLRCISVTLLVTALVIAAYSDRDVFQFHDDSLHLNNRGPNEQEQAEQEGASRLEPRSS